MKVIGHYSLRGRINASEWNTPLEILLDYGDMKVAYRVTSFYVNLPEALTSQDNCYGKLATSSNVDADPLIWHWEDNREIAWAQSVTGAIGRRNMQAGPVNGTIDGDNLVVENLYLVIGSDTSTETSLNYMIEMEKLQVAPEVTIMTQINQVDQSS